jgi:Domain of unknown function (DUF1905)/Bacteriocin-protection, YdeI or OmpD-Associated
MSAIRFETKLCKIGSWTILRLPESASAKLPSRGQTMVKGTLNGFPFQTPLEPDGKWSHWFRVDKAMREAAGVDEGDTVTLAIEPTKEWPEPDVPADVKSALAATPEAYSLWQQITPMARWEWIRWIRSTSQTETRQRRALLQQTAPQYREASPSQKRTLLDAFVAATGYHRTYARWLLNHAEGVQQTLRHNMGQKSNTRCSWCGTPPTASAPNGLSLFSPRLSKPWSGMSTSTSPRNVEANCFP